MSNIALLYISLRESINIFPLSLKGALDSFSLIFFLFFISRVRNTITESRTTDSTYCEPHAESVEPT